MSTPPSSSTSSNESSGTDLLLTEFLGRRGLDGIALDRIGARWESDSGRILYPRYGRRPEHSVPPDEVEIVGWKVRDLAHDKQFNTPAGIPHNATWPLIIRDVFPASMLLVCEGETDTMRIGQSGLLGRFYADVMCVPGANAFPSEWVAFVRSYERVIVIRDGDDAGMALPNKIASMVPGTRCVNMPAGHDVCSFLQAHSEDDLATLIEIAPLIITQQKIRRENWDWQDSAARDHRDKLTRIVAQDVQMRRRGKEFIGLCPFHEEKTPSFSVNPEKGLYRCWGCKAAGDVITYLQKKRGMSFREAMDALERIT